MLTLADQKRHHGEDRYAGLYAVRYAARTRASIAVGGAGASQSRKTEFSGSFSIMTISPLRPRSNQRTQPPAKRFPRTVQAALYRAGFDSRHTGDLFQ